MSAVFCADVQLVSLSRLVQHRTATTEVKWFLLTQLHLGSQSECYIQTVSYASGRAPPIISLI